MTVPIGSKRRLRRFIAAAIVVVAALVVWVAVDTAQGVASRREERHGQVTVSRCDFLTFGKHVNSYSCAGKFTSDAGDLRIPSVSFTYTGSLDRGESVAGTVSGPGDDTASIDSEFALVLRLISIAGGAAAVAALLLRLRRLRRAVQG